MDERRGRRLADSSRQLLGIPDVSLVRNGDVTELGHEVPADEPRRPGDEDPAYCSSPPRFSCLKPLSRRASRWARIRFSSASFEITVE